jgi:putative serine protease PepD
VLALLGATVLAGAGGVWVGATLLDDDGPTASTPTSTSVTTDVQVATPSDPVASTSGGRIDVAAVADRIAPSVVTISADVESGGLVGGSVGTGVVITPDGQVLTNAHVVEGATEIRVRLNGETEPRPAELLAADPGNDLALLQVEGGDLVPATFAAPDSVRIGDEVVAIGFALDLDGEPSVTLGIVSALDRTITTANGALNGLVQTDAAISSGNSGGPLVNSAGEVVGINTAVARATATTAASNIGFAISSGEVLEVLDGLRAEAAGSSRTEGYLGVGLADRSDGGQGAVVTEVQPDSPAALAGVLAGDVVVEVSGRAIDGSAGLIAAIRDREPGDSVAVVVLRDGERRTFDVVLVERPGD